MLAEPGTALRETVMAACQDRGFSPVPLLEVGDPATVRFLVNAGLGVSLVPASWLQVPGASVAVAALVEPAPRHALSLLAAGELTPAGRLLTQESARMSQDMARLTRRVKQVAGGWEDRLAIVHHNPLKVLPAFGKM